MKRIPLGLLIIILLVLFTNASAFISQSSFRIQGMGCELRDFTRDEYSDIYYNPHYLMRISGTRIYTNLSNLSGVSPASFAATDINLLRNTLYPTNLLGIIYPRNEIKLGVIAASSGFSLGAVQESSSNSDYQRIEIESTEEKYESEGHIGGKDVNLFYSSPRFGGLFTYSSFSAGYSWIDETTDRHSNFDGTPRRVQEDKNEFGAKSANHLFGFYFGQVRGDENNEISLSGGFKPSLFSASMEDLDSYISDFLDPTWRDSYADKLSGEESVSATGLTGFLNYRNRFASKTNAYDSRVLRASLSWVPFKFNQDDYDYTEVWDGQRSSPNYYHEFRKEKYSAEEEFGGSAFVINLMGGYGREFQFVNENTTLLVIGGKLNYFFIHAAGKLDPVDRITTFYREYPNAPDNSNDNGYFRSENTNETTTLSGNVNAIIANFPVGIETPITKKLTLRLGANGVVPLFVHGSMEWEEEDLPDYYYIRTTHGPNTGNVIEGYLDEPTFNSTDKVSTKGLQANLTSYNIGLGWKINDHLNLDMLHFSQITNLGTWWLSLGIRLD